MSSPLPFFLLLCPSPFKPPTPHRALKHVEFRPGRVWGGEGWMEVGGGDDGCEIISIKTRR